MMKPLHRSIVFVSFRTRNVESTCIEYFFLLMVDQAINGSERERNKILFTSLTLHSFILGSINMHTIKQNNENVPVDWIKVTDITLSNCIQKKEGEREKKKLPSLYTWIRSCDIFYLTRQMLRGSGEPVSNDSVCVYIECEKVSEVNTLWPHTHTHSRVNHSYNDTHLHETKSESESESKGNSDILVSS